MANRPLRQPMSFVLAALLSAVCGSAAVAGEPAGTDPASTVATEPEATSLFGAPLTPPALPAEVERQRLAELAAAQERYQAAPDDPEALIWLGRRTAYLGRYRAAVELFSQGVERFPDDARFLRHRGHRSITLRRFEAAIADLERAAALVRGQPDRVEPDGLPNDRGIPTSTLKTNIAYHLGLARYLSGDLEGAADAYFECLGASANPDMLVATTYWLVMTLERLGRGEAADRLLAPITADLDIIENDAYHRLLLLFKGERQAAELLAGAQDSAFELATVGYGLATWHAIEERQREAEALYRRIVSGDQWAAFGHIAAEAELARSGR